MSAASEWIELKVERVLYVDHGRDTILCTRRWISESGGTLVLRVSADALKKLRSPTPEIEKEGEK